MSLENKASGVSLHEREKALRKALAQQGNVHEAWHALMAEIIQEQLPSSIVSAETHPKSDPLRPINIAALFITFPQLAGANTGLINYMISEVAGGKSFFDIIQQYRQDPGFMSLLQENSRPYDAAFTAALRTDGNTSPLTPGDIISLAEHLMYRPDQPPTHAKFTGLTGTELHLITRRSDGIYFPPDTYTITAVPLIPKAPGNTMNLSDTPMLSLSRPEVLLVRAGTDSGKVYCWVSTQGKQINSKTSNAPNLSALEAIIRALHPDDSLTTVPEQLPYDSAGIRARYLTGTYDYERYQRPPTGIFAKKDPTADRILYAAYGDIGLVRTMEQIDPTTLATHPILKSLTKLQRVSAIAQLHKGMIPYNGKSTEFSQLLYKVIPSIDDAVKKIIERFEERGYAINVENNGEPYFVSISGLREELLSRISMPLTAELVAKLDILSNRTNIPDIRRNAHNYINPIPLPPGLPSYAQLHTDLTGLEHQLYYILRDRVGYEEARRLWGEGNPAVLERLAELTSQQSRHPASLPPNLLETARTIATEMRFLPGTIEEFIRRLAASTNSPVSASQPRQIQAPPQTPHTDETTAQATLSVIFKEESPPSNTKKQESSSTEQINKLIKEHPSIPLDKPYLVYLFLFCCATEQDFDKANQLIAKISVNPDNTYTLGETNKPWELSDYHTFIKFWQSYRTRGVQQVEITDVIHHHAFTPIRIDEISELAATEAVVALLRTLQAMPTKKPGITLTINTLDWMGGQMSANTDIAIANQSIRRRSTHDLDFHVLSNRIYYYYIEAIKADLQKNNITLLPPQLEPQARPHTLSHEVNPQSRRRTSSDSKGSIMEHVTFRNVATVTTLLSLLAALTVTASNEEARRAVAGAITSAMGGWVTPSESEFPTPTPVEINPTPDPKQTPVSPTGNEASNNPPDTTPTYNPELVAAVHQGTEAIMTDAAKPLIQDISARAERTGEKFIPEENQKFLFVVPTVIGNQQTLIAWGIATRIPNTPPPSFEKITLDDNDLELLQKIIEDTGNHSPRGPFTRSNDQIAIYHASLTTPGQPGSPSRSQLDLHKIGMGLTPFLVEGTNAQLSMVTVTSAIDYVLIPIDTSN